MLSSSLKTELGVESNWFFGQACGGFFQSIVVYYRLPQEAQTRSSGADLGMKLGNGGLCSACGHNNVGAVGGSGVS